MEIKTVEKENLQADSLYNLAFVGDPQLSPDGKKIVYVKKKITSDHEYASYLVMVDGETGEEVPWTSPSSPHLDSSPRWSPDGEKLAFVSNRSGENQIWIISALGGEAFQLTSLENGAGSPVWKPDGSALLVLCNRYPKGKKEEANKKKTALVVEDLHYKADGKGFLDGKHTQVAVINSTTGEETWITDAELDHSYPNWSPDGETIVYVRSRREENGAYIQSDLFIKKLAEDDRNKPEQLNTEGGSFIAPRWAPDGTTLSYIGHDFKHEGATLNKVWTVDVKSKTFNCLTDSFDLECSDVLISDLHWGINSPGAIWSKDARELYFLGSERGNTGIYSINLDGTLRQIAGGDRHHYTFHAVVDHGEAVVAISDTTNIGDIYTFSLEEDASPKRMTSSNEEVLSDYPLSTPEAFTYEGRDGLNVQGWIMKPIGFEEGRQYPTVLEIHGGPHMMYGNSFMHEFQLLAAKGYVVVFTNPRGSQGYGQDFVNGCRGDYGGGDFDDVMAGIEAAVDRNRFIDADCLFVTGGSYGGFMTNWIIGKTNVFKAAVTQRSISNWLSFYGVSDIGYFFTKWEVGADLDEDPTKLWGHSPLKYVNDIETPLLILHSEKDYRCPIEQGEQLYIALKHREKKTKFVRFPDSDHNLSRSGHPELRVERLNHLIGWFDDHLDGDQA
ncbi:S9 family peptidase [Guptibacillus algicola]|uniref:S9 family peptidase n=1 Tax=Guptibacillus algicola TaxID=225844 RepID=UPI001CD42E02|nr:S9 family peptidase [Alkalihalobacillus algicola]MCA0986911.1 S9 family peptidase [Alkalihalobacillus algicola]